MSKILNNAALISSHVVGSTSHASFFIQLQMFSIRFTSGDCEDIASCVNHCFQIRQHHHGSVAKSIILLEHKWVLLVPMYLLYWFQQIFIHGVNVRMLLEFSSKTTKLQAPWMLMHPQTIAETFARSLNYIASQFILYPFSLTSFTSMISLKNKRTLSREHHKGPINIGSPLLNSLAHLMRIWRFWDEPRGFFLATRLNIAPACM